MLDLSPPGLVVNTMRGDPAERRAGGWLAWDGALDLDAAIVGVPYDGASVVRSGSRHGPDAIRQAMMYFTTWSSFEKRDMGRLRAADVGDVPVVLTDMATTFARITDTVAELVGRGCAPILIGGDHSIAFPHMRGILKGMGTDKRLGVIHFDAHHDLREAHLGAESSGVPFRKALELLDGRVRGRNLVQVGMAEFTNARSLSDYAEGVGATVISGLEVRRRGIDDVIDEALVTASDGVDGLYVSVDIDCIDQSQAPGTAAPNPFGLDARDVQAALRRVAAHPLFVAADLVEISPPFDPRNITGATGASLVLSILWGLASRKGVLS